MENADFQLSFKSKCIIHSKTSRDDDEHLISPQSIASWLTLLDAARVRNYVPILDIANQHNNKDEIPTLSYHRNCRSLFTMKRELDSLKRKAVDIHSTEGEGSSTSKRSARRVSSEGSRVYDPSCIFCNKVKYQKNSRTREKLTQAVQLRADKRLRECAIQKGDDTVLALTSRDIVAAEAHYHASCYKSYTKQLGKGECDQISTSENAEQENSDIVYKKIEKEAYEDLFTYIRMDIIPNKTIVPFTSLRNKLQVFMKANGVEHINDSAKTHFRRTIESSLGNAVNIVSDELRHLVFLVPESISLKDVVLENQRLHKELALFKAKSTNCYKIIDQASSQIRSVIKKEMTFTPWPYHPCNVGNNVLIDIPNELNRFLCGLLTGDPEPKLQVNRTHILIQSFSQDIIYAVTCGQYKPPKHILLPNAVKTLTGNIELIKTLNKFGHSVSYSQLEENETALCLQKLAASVHQSVLLPAEIRPHVFTNVAWDNIDRLEETLTGKGTSHRVNGIAVQNKTYGPHLPALPLPQIEKGHQRSVVVDQQELELYIAGTRVGPQPLVTRRNEFHDHEQSFWLAQSKNLIWMLARHIHSEHMSIPSWTGFNIITRDRISIVEDTVGYLPTINAPATELTTVLEILKQTDIIRKQLHLETIVAVMDQALYAKATEILWKHKEQFSNILLRMGTFHTICNVLSILGKRFRDAGLKDICIESRIVAEGSINGVLDGKHYNRAVRVHKYIYEALMRLAWGEFISWMEETTPEKKDAIKQLMDTICDSVDNFNQVVFTGILDSSLLNDVVDLWNRYLEHLRHNNGELSAFWMSYIDIVEQVLLGLLRASREGNWNLHLSAIRAMIPWCFAYDKLNYARYLSPYFAQMSNLPVTLPQVYTAFLDGQFSVQLSPNNPFGRLPVDQTTEVTVNKDTQTPGGTTRFSLNAGAIKRYYITAEYRSSFLGQLRDMVQGNQAGLSHSELQHTRIQKDEEAVSAIVDLINDWTNPFKEKQDLVSISTAKAATRDVASDILDAYAIGKTNYERFKEERIDTDPPTKKFHEPLKTNRLKTFSNLCKTKEIKTNGRFAILKADRSLFGRIIVMAQGRNLQMEEILSHPLGPLPWSLSSPDGLLRKTNKAALATTLQKNVKLAEQIPSKSASVIDGMNLVQRLKCDQGTFADVAVSLLQSALREGSGSDRIDVVFDTYRHNSIKNSERSLRGNDSGHQLQNITRTQIVRQWRNFLTSVTNKNSLISFLVNEWMKEEYREKLKGKILFATVNDKCYRISPQSSNEVPELRCQHEEADGRLLFHAAHASRNGYHAIVICAEDTDVFIIALSFVDTIGVPIYQKCGTKTRTRIVDITKIASTVGKDVSKALIGMHAYTGCDTVSAFAGKGKASALKLLISNKEHQETFLQLGQEWNLTPQLMDKLERFTCLLYASKASAVKVNNLRYDIFCAKKGEIESHQLPPCFDCLFNHAKRANYQAALWRRSIHHDAQEPSSVGYGWTMENESGEEKLVVHWMDGQPAPEAVLDLLACNCSRKCSHPKCVCLSNGLKCTDMCRLQDCDNQTLTNESDTEDIDNDEIEDIGL